MPGILSVPKCTIETQLRSFYFKMFHKAIAFNSFLHKIGRKDSPLCVFCDKDPETVVHVFYICDKVKTLWNELQEWVNDKLGINNFELMFGVSDDKFLSYLFLCCTCKFYIYRCKFQHVVPNFVAFKNFLLVKRKVEYDIAYKKDKLRNNFRKWSLDF